MNQPLTKEQALERKKDFESRKAHLFEQFQNERELIQDVIDEMDEILGTECPEWVKNKPHGK